MFPNVELGDILLTKIGLTLDGHFNICESIVDSDIANGYSLCLKESALSSNLWDSKVRLRALGKAFFHHLYFLTYSLSILSTKHMIFEMQKCKVDPQKIQKRRFIMWHMSIHPQVQVFGFWKSNNHHFQFLFFFFLPLWEWGCINIRTNSLIFWE